MILVLVGVVLLGSSPRVRGTVGLQCHAYATTRFIPARAGNGWKCVLLACLSTVHPRACGERFRLKLGIYHATGSSPRVRGTGCCTRLPFARIRFIPARAGNGGYADSDIDDTSVHPRACGERQPNSRQRLQQLGSSPRVRGTAATGLPVAQVPRFIPARAGNGRRCFHSVSRGAVHPRACGERNGSGTTSSSNYGSSPRVRGTVPCQVVLWSCQRFIPARAGNGRIEIAHIGGLSVHPRACGEREVCPSV